MQESPSSGKVPLDSTLISYKISVQISNILFHLSTFIAHF